MMITVTILAVVCLQEAVLLGFLWKYAIETKSTLKSLIDAHNTSVGRLNDLAEQVEGEDAGQTIGFRGGVE